MAGFSTGMARMEGERGVWFGTPRRMPAALSVDQECEEVVVRDRRER